MGPDYVGKIISEYQKNFSLYDQIPQWPVIDWEKDNLKEGLTFINFFTPPPSVRSPAPLGAS